MALEPGFIAVIVLGSVLALLLFAFAATSVVLLRKKRLLCFRHAGYTRPFLHSDLDFPRRRGKSRIPLDWRHGKKNKKKKKTQHYQSFSKGLKFPKRDIFARNFLENPMVDTDELDADWTNPAFDEAAAYIHDAAVSVQSWYRMIRYSWCSD